MSTNEQKIYNHIYLINICQNHKYWIKFTLFLLHLKKKTNIQFSASKNKTFIF